MNRVEAANWQRRFWAWAIDLLLLSIPWYLLMYALSLNPIGILGLVYYGASMFLYWTILEGFRGQSLGKMVQNLAVVGHYGESIGFKDAAIESFGKAFLLPLDLLVGFIAWPESGQRLFNRISNTVVSDVGQQ